VIRSVTLAPTSFDRIPAHSAGDHMREDGESLQTIQKRLPHASIRTTGDMYGTLNVVADKPAAERLDAVSSARGRSIPDCNVRKWPFMDFCA
jgi:hypothetical protein